MIDLLKPIKYLLWRWSEYGLRIADEDERQLIGADIDKPSAPAATAQPRAANGRFLPKQKAGSRG